MTKPTGTFPGEPFVGHRKHTCFEATEEYRCPHLGEYYLCGNPLRAFKCLGHCNTKRWIAVPIPPGKHRPNYRQALLTLLQKLTTGGGIHVNPYSHPEVTDAILALTNGRSKYDLPAA